MLNLEAAKRVGMVEVSPAFRAVSRDLSIEELAATAYKLRDELQYTREDLAAEIGVAEEELFDVELGRMSDRSRAREVVQMVLGFKERVRSSRQVE